MSSDPIVRALMDHHGQTGLGIAIEQDGAVTRYTLFSTAGCGLELSGAVMGRIADLAHPRLVDIRPGSAPAVWVVEVAAAADLARPLNPH